MSDGHAVPARSSLRSTEPQAPFKRAEQEFAGLKSERVKLCFMFSSLRQEGYKWIYGEQCRSLAVNRRTKKETCADTRRDNPEMELSRFNSQRPQQSLSLKEGLCRDFGNF